MRLKPEDRKSQILKAALIVASRPGGWSKLNRESVAIEAGCTKGLVTNYFGTMLCFRRSIMRAAIHQKYLSIIAQGLASGDEHAQKADDTLKAAALDTLR